MGDFNALAPDCTMSFLYTNQHGDGGNGEFDEICQGAGLTGAASPPTQARCRDYIFSKRHIDGESRRPLIGHVRSCLVDRPPSRLPNRLRTLWVPVSTPTAGLIFVS
jgi:hypothetical protein